ncbi:MAG: hypothetical protein JSS56_19430 [Proteobacteria bacterium]|nr:hypothetical protein [Pseudomonadota bacterium]
MTPIRQLAAAACCLSCLSAGAADFSDTAVGITQGWRYSNPGTNASDVQRTTVHLDHFSTDRLGSNLAHAEFVRSSDNEPAAGGGGGAQEAYGFYSRDWSFAKIAGHQFPGPVRDVSLTTRMDAATKNDAFAEKPVMLILGPTVSLAVPGYLGLGLYAYKEWNHNGIVGTDVNFDLTVRAAASWDFPLGNAWNLRGFLQVTGPKGKDGFGNQTKTETMAQVRLLADLGALSGGPRSGLELGVGFEYWHNKFGNDPAFVPPGTAQQFAPLMTLQYHF